MSGRGKFFLSAAVGALLLAGAAVAVIVWTRERDRRVCVAAAIPAVPDTGALSPEFRRRIEDCGTRARNGPDRVDALGELSRLYHANGFYSEASRCYEALIQVDPGNPRWLHRFATILAGYGQLDDALPLWRRAAEIAPDYIPTLLKQADALLKMNRDEEAAVAYGAVLKREARNPWALVGLARIDMDAGRFEDARGRLEAAVEESNWGIGYDLLPTVYERLGMNERVAEIRGRAKAFGTFSDTPDPWMLELYDDCYDVYRLMLAGGDANFVGDLPRAVRIIERALSLAPDNATVHFQLAGLYLAANRRVDARRQFEQCLAANPEQPDAWFQLSRVLADLGDARGSDRTLDAGLSRCPGSPGLHMEHGRRLAAAGRSEEAISEYKETIRLRPQEAGGYVDLAGLYFKLGRLDEGVAQLMRSLEMEPENPVALSAAALYSVTTGDEATAAEWIRRVRLQPRISAKERTNIEAAFVQRFGRPPQ